MKHHEAKKRLMTGLSRIHEPMRYAGAIAEIWVFGSFARGAPDVGDVDLAIQFDRTSDDFRALLSRERLFTWEAVIKRELFERQRVFSCQFDQLPELRNHFAEDTWIQLYKTGDSANTVAARIESIEVDHASTRAPRPDPPAELGPYANDIAVADIEVLIDLVARGLLELTPVDVPVIADLPPRIESMLDKLWDHGSPRRHQVAVAASFLHRHGTRRISVQRDSWQPVTGAGEIAGATIGPHAPSTVVRLLTNPQLRTKWLMVCKTPKRTTWGAWICSTSDPKALGDHYWRAPW